MPDPKQAGGEGQATETPEEREAREARRNDRVTINKEFESYDAFINEYVTNISRTGVFVRSKTPLAIGTKVNLRFTVIMDDIETVEGLGEVVRVHDDPPGMGVVFTELSAYSKGLIDKLLTNQGRSQAGERPGALPDVAQAGELPGAPPDEG